MKRHIDLRLTGILVSTLIIGFIVLMTFASVNNYSKRADTRETEKIADIITRAAIQCYALEGGYPPSLEYLAEKYEILLDRNNFIYYYDTHGVDNILPEVIVQPRLRY